MTSVEQQYENLLEETRQELESLRMLKEDNEREMLTKKVITVRTAIMMYRRKQTNRNRTTKPSVPSYRHHVLHSGLQLVIVALASQYHNRYVV